MKLPYLIAALILIAPISIAQNLDDDFLALMTYEPGADAAALERIEAASHGNSAERGALEERLAGVLASKGSTPGAKDFTAKQLNRIGTSACIPKIAPLLLNADTADLARYVLERMEGGAATDALLSALSKTRGAVRVGILHTLGERGDSSSVARIKQLTGNGDPAVMRAAMIALGKIGGQDAADQLLWCSRNVRRDLRDVASEAFLRCADGFLAAGDDEIAAAMYDRYMIEAEALPLRMTALQGLVRAEPEKAVQVIVEVFSGSDADLWAAAAGVAGDLTGADATTIGGALASMSAGAKAHAIRALGVIGDAAVRDSVVGALRDPDAEVRAAAYEALATLGDADMVPAILRAAASASGAELESARACLAELRDPATDSALGRALLGVENAVRVEALWALAARGSGDAVPAIVRTVERERGPLRVAAIEALGACGTITELKTLIDALSGGDAAERSEAEDAIVALAKRAAADPGRIEPIVQGMNRGSSETRVALVRALGRIGDDSAIKTLRGEARGKKSETSDAAIQALANWRTAAPFADLVEIAGRAKEESQREAAFAGALRLIGLDRDRSADETLAMYQEVAAIAETAALKQQFLAAVVKFDDARALSLIEPYLADAEVQADAEAAREKVEAKGK
ncbi:MAG: HEAT repeat domain-containing protein [Candidatus Hydrogenedentota bacterium]